MASTSWDRLKLPLLASLTLGLAPFSPEPHVVEKLRWLVMEGGVGMAPVDVFDLVMHGAPWVWLMVEVIRTQVGAGPAEAPKEGT